MICYVYTAPNDLSFLAVTSFDIWGDAARRSLS